MPQITLHKLHTRERADFRTIARVAILPAEADGIVADPKHTGIADGRMRDVDSQG